MYIYIIHIYIDKMKIAIIKPIHKKKSKNNF